MPIAPLSAESLLLLRHLERSPTRLLTYQVSFTAYFGLMQLTQRLGGHILDTILRPGSRIEFGTWTKLDAAAQAASIPSRGGGVVY
jgi:hypothetical protein